MKRRLCRGAFLALLLGAALVWAKVLPPLSAAKMTVILLVLVAVMLDGTMRGSEFLGSLEEGEKESETGAKED